MRRGYSSYHVIDESISPIVWHIESHKDSLTRRGGLRGDFWIHYDRAMSFFRLRSLGAGVSWLAYTAAMARLSLARPLSRIPATLYAVVRGVLGR
ncbi:MAG: hypothetical protein ACP5I3_11575 [Thermoproteus sp.]